MKLKIMTLLICISGLASFAQITLKSSSHALSVTENNYMTTCNYLKPGESGTNVTWNFENLEPLSVLHAELEDYSSIYDRYNFVKSNTVLNEFGNKFLFHVTDNEIQQTGYVSANGRTSIRYDSPFIKMKFPLSYNQSYTGNFTGDYISGNFKGSIKGDYQIWADAYGTLKLPNNTTYHNTLRVKTVKTYQRVLGDNVQDIEVTSYRWYNEYFRYPLLVLTSYDVKTGSGTSTRYQAAYNTDVIVPPENMSLNDSFKWSVYPNPASEYVYVEFNIPESTDVKLSLYDMEGRLVTSVMQIKDAAGQYYSGFYPAEYQLQHGVYFLKVETGYGTYTKEFMYTER
jgi:hypothetical protein